MQTLVIHVQQRRHALGDHACANTWYHVGSKHEMSGRTGFAHLSEHMMFTGLGHVPYRLRDRLTEGIGGSKNGTTPNDRTTCVETVPPDYFESALWREADRMGFLLDTLDIATLNAQRDIVKNGAGFDGDPGYFETAYKKSQAVTAADVKRAANRCLTTGRVVLSVVPTGMLDQASKPAYQTRNDFRVVSDPQASNQSTPSLTRSNFSW